VRIFEVVKCREILRMLSADVMGKMQMWKCGYVTAEFMLKLLLIFVLHTASVLSYIGTPNCIILVTFPLQRKWAQLF